MTTTNILFNKEKIKQRIFGESGYASLSRCKAGIPAEFTDVLAITPDDLRIIKPIIQESINEIVTNISRYTTRCTPPTLHAAESDDTTLTITLPGNYPTSAITQLESAIESYIVNNTLTRWTLIVKPDESTLHNTKTQNNIIKIRELLALRERPELKATGQDQTIKL